MSTRVDQLSEILGSLKEARDVGQDYASDRDSVAARGAETGFEFWRGGSGTTYVHSIYPLIGCPELPQANFLLVHRDTDGTKSVRHIGQTTHTCPSLNRAHVRQLGAEHEVNEVHVHFLGSDARSRSVIAFDLAAWSVDPVADDVVCS